MSPRPDRQARRSGETSAKLDTLLPPGRSLRRRPQVLVFSQFTSLLAIVRSGWTNGITYEYLDGKTRNRQEKVRPLPKRRRVQAFLISLKAGGVGLNLTAAE